MDSPLLSCNTRGRCLPSCCLATLWSNPLQYYHVYFLLSFVMEMQYVFCDVYFFLVSWVGLRLSPLGTSATNWPTVPGLDNKWMWSSRWNENWQGKPKYSEKTCPSATLSTTNPTWPDLGSNPGRLGGNPATSRRSYGSALRGVNLNLY
jgi:hypothetical protein